MCKTQITYNADDTILTRLEGHTFQHEVCVWCGIEVHGLEDYIKRNAVLIVDIQGDLAENKLESSI